MPSFLIIHSALHDGELSAYRQPPTLDITGLRASLDWGDITLHVPAGDLPVTVYVTRSNGQVEGATITVRAPAGTGTRLTFVPPLQPGGRSLLRIDGQWPADATMHYYAARDARALQQPTQPMPWKGPAQSSPSQHRQPLQQQAHDGRQERLERAEAPRVSPVLGRIDAPTPPIGPTPGSTGAVPLQPSSFGHEQGARVDPVRPSAPSSRSGQQGPSFGQRSQRDVYGRERAVDDHRPPSIPTPEEFHRLEQEAAEAQRRVYEAWQVQQPGAQRSDDGAQRSDDGAPRPVGLGASSGQPQASWYPDPFRRADARWFDGRQWTASIMRGGVRATDQPG